MIEYIKIGQITKPFGLKGELKVYSYTDFIEERFKKNNIVYVKYNNEYIEMIVDSYKIHKGLINIKFKNYNDINLVEKYSGCDIVIDKKMLHELKNGEYYTFQLENLKVYDESDNYLGILSKVEQGVTHNNFRIVNNDKSFLVPNIPIFIKKIDIDNKKIIIKVMDGLI